MPVTPEMIFTLELASSAASNFDSSTVKFKLLAPANTAFLMSLAFEWGVMVLFICIKAFSCSFISPPFGTSLIRSATTFEAIILFIKRLCAFFVASSAALE